MLRLPLPIIALTYALLAPVPLAAAPSDEPPPLLALPDALGLDDALRLFHERGLDLLIADAQVASAEGDLHAAGVVPNPQLSGGFTRSFFKGDAFETPWGFFVGLNDNNAIEDSLSGKRGLRLKVARAALAAARSGRADAERALAFQVKQQYIAAVFARDSLDFALQVQEAMARVFELNQVRYRAGAISEADLAKIETAKLEADQAVDAATQALRAAKVGLAFLLGVRGPVPDYKVDQDLPRFRVPPALADASAESLLERAREHRPDLKAIAAQRERAGASVTLAKRLRFPDMSLNAQYSQQGTYGGNNQITPPTLTVGLAMTLPVFYFQRGEIERARADERTQAVQSAKVEAQVASDVAGAFNNFVSSRRLVERMEGRLLDRARRARDLISLQYQKGAASLLEYLDAQRTFIANNQEYLQDLTNYWTAVYQLEAAVGMELR